MHTGRCVVVTVIDRLPFFCFGVRNFGAAAERNLQAQTHLSSWPDVIMASPLITGHHVNKGNHKSSLALTNICKTLIHVLKFSLDLIIFTLHDGAQGNHT